MPRNSRWTLNDVRMTLRLNSELASGARKSPEVEKKDTCTASFGNATQPEQPSFLHAWYAVGIPGQLEHGKLFATQLFGEPLVLYRDAQEGIACVRDVCPHRSAPLSMGDVQGGVLRCFYHGWGFGEQGKCVNVPTISLTGSKAPPNLDRFCATAYAAVEHAGLLWVWRGSPLTADTRKLPRHPSPDQTFAVVTMLDYACDWPFVVESSLESPFWRFHGDPSNVARFDLPNVVRHYDVSGVSEEAHAVPIAPYRTRVILRQRFREGPILSKLLKIPGARSLLTNVVRNWNYRISLEDYPAIQSRARNSDKADFPQTPKPGSRSEHACHFWEWHRRAREREGQQYFLRWDGRIAEPRYGPQTDDDDVVGTFGLKKNYVQNNPPAENAPACYAPYKEFQDATRAAIAGAITVPAATLTWKTVAPAVGAMVGADM